MRNFVICGLASIFLFGTGAASASILYGVSGDGANPSETFYSISTTDASLSFIQTLGNGGDGESISYDPVSGLMNHWSGLSSQVMETINLNDQTIANVSNAFGLYNPDEVFGSTYNSTTANFLFTDINGNLGSVSAGGVFSEIGVLPGLSIRGLAFNGGNLFGGDRDANMLYDINPATGASNGSVSVTMNGFTVQGINSLTTDLVTGELYALLKTDQGRRLATLDAGTGVATDIGRFSDNIANIEFGRAIPEPSVVALFAAGLLGLGFARRRMHR